MRVAIESVLLLAFVNVRPSFAQVRIEITPLVGVYAPSGSSYGSTPGGGQTPGGSIPAASVQETSAFAGGALLTAWVSTRVGLEVGAAYSPSGVARCFGPSYGFQGSDPGGCSDSSGQVFAGSARLLLSLGPPVRGQVSTYLLAGVSVLHRPGPTMDQQCEGEFGPGIPGNCIGALPLAFTEWEPTLGIGVRMPVTRALAPRAELAFMGYRGSAFNALLSVGLSMALLNGETR